MNLAIVRYKLLLLLKGFPLYLEKPGIKRNFEKKPRILTKGLVFLTILTF